MAIGQKAGGLAALAGQNCPDFLASGENPAIYRAISHGNMGQKAVRWQPSGEAFVFSHVSVGTNPRTHTMALPAFSMRQLLEAAVPLRHQPPRWNPHMADSIFG